jgi:hypothetical protein
MELFSLIRNSDCCEYHNCGIFESVDAVIERLKTLSLIMNAGDKFTVECFELCTYAEEKHSTEILLAHRAKYLAKKALEDKEAE